MIVTRFAPAPTGFLHIGHVVNAVYVWGIARACGGRVLLRIEDHDRQRSRREYEQAILEDLDWLGFVADEPLVRQSERTPLYETALESLRLKNLVYGCECSRRDIDSAGDTSSGERRYPGTCSMKNLPERPGLGVRLRVSGECERFDDLITGPHEQCPSDQCGDMLLRDRDANWTYQFAVSVDDWLQGVTLIVRGEDLLGSTGRQFQLARLLGRPVPPIVLHHPLVMKSPSQKVSKSDGDTGVRDFRARGWTAEDVIGEAIRVAGLTPDRRPVTVRDLTSLPELAALASRVAARSASAG